MQDMEQLYQTYAQLIYRYLISLCHDREWAMDMTQETFLRAVARIDTYENNGKSRISTWLCQIAKYVWYQELEKKNRQKNAAFREKEPAEAEREPEKMLLQKETRVELYRMVQELEEPQKSVVQLRLSGELSFQEIGEILGRSENWARVTYYRCREKLAERITEKQKQLKNGKQS